MTRMNLLLFSERGILFGVYAGQIEELLETRNISGSFDNTGEMTIVYKARQIRVIHVVRWLRLEKHADGLGCRLSDASPATSPRILILRCRDGSYKGIWVDHLRQLVTVPIEHIHALPILMEQNKQIQGIWGLAIVDTQLIILIDLEQLS